MRQPARLPKYSLPRIPRQRKNIAGTVVKGAVDIATIGVAGSVLTGVIGAIKK